MIHNTIPGQPKRRIAIVQIARPQQTRLGSIGNGSPAPALAWTTIEDEQPESSSSWLGYQLMQQSWNRNNTPGTLTYTPASVTPAPNVPVYNSWQQPNCVPQTQAPAPAAAAPMAGAYSKLWIGIGLLGAAASLSYLLGEKGRR